MENKTQDITVTSIVNKILEKTPGTQFSLEKVKFYRQHYGVIEGELQREVPRNRD